MEEVISLYCYVGSAEAVCNLNVGPYVINLECLPYGDPTKPYDITLGQFNFGAWFGTPDDFWIASSTGTSGNNIIDGNALLAAIEASSMGTVAQAGNGTYLGEKVYFQINGGDGNDSITGGANWDVLHGNNGNDVLNGLGGSDQVYGDAGNDVVYGGDGQDYVYGGFGNDSVNGDAGNDNVVGGFGADVVNGGDGADNLFGDSDGSMVVALSDGTYYAPETAWDGNDTMNGGTGNDMMFGQGGADSMIGGLGDDGMDGGSGNDKIYGGDGIDNITGGSGNDVIYGGYGNDMINAGAGNDYVNGGAGDDWISGGAGNDVLTGGTGKDHFVFCEASCVGDDHITDFTTTIMRDQIDLTQMSSLSLVISAATGNDNSAFLELISFGADGKAGGGDDYSLGTIYIDSMQSIAHVFDLDTTFGSSSNSLVKVQTGVMIDLPSDSYVYTGELV